MIKFTEHDDRFESVIFIDEIELVLSIDKPISSSAFQNISTVFENSHKLLVKNSLAYIKQQKEAYEIPYLDDFSDPQIIGDDQQVSVYWYSKKGEESGASIIGVDFSLDKLEPINLVIGD